jgi:type I restriction enzyme, S subunit
MAKASDSLRFGDVAEFRNGLNFAKSSRGKGCALIGIPDFQNRFTPNYDELAEIDPTGIVKPEDYVQKGDILFVRSNGNKELVGRSLLIDREITALFSGFCIRARIHSEKVDPVFCAYFTKTATFRSSISGHVGTSINNLNQGILGDIALPPLSLSDQKAIVSVLSALDSKIELNQRMNEELERMAKLLYDYWFVQFDFPMNAAQAAALGKPQLAGKPYRASGGRMIYNEYLKRNVPEGWILNKLGDIVESISTGLNPRKHFTLGSGSNFYVTIKSIEHGKLLLDSKCDRIDDSALSRIDQRSKLRPGDILFTSIEPVGRLYLIQETPRNWNINESLFSIRPNRERVNSSYLYYLLSSHDCKGYCKKVSTGSIHQGIRIAALRDYTFALPERQLLEAYSKICEPLLKQVHTLNKQNEELTQLRDWLLPMLMNGQVSVA